MYELNGVIFQTFMHHVLKDENFQDQEVKKIFSKLLNNKCLERIGDPCEK